MFRCPSPVGTLTLSTPNGSFTVEKTCEFVLLCRMSKYDFILRLTEIKTDHSNKKSQT